MRKKKKTLNPEKEIQLSLEGLYIFSQQEKNKDLTIQG